MKSGESMSETEGWVDSAGVNRGFPTRMVYLNYISRVPDQNGVSPQYIMLEILHSGWEPSISL